VTGTTARFGLGTRLRELPARALRKLFLFLSRRRSLGRLATRLPITRAMVARFVAGEELGPALAAIEQLRAAGFRTTVDVLGESVTSADAAKAASGAYLELLDALAERGLDANVSVKLSQMGLGLDLDLCRANVARIVERAAAHGAFVRIDMEDHTTTDRTLALVRELRPTAADGDAADGDAADGDLGVVIQSALRRSPADVEALIGQGIRVRLCKGAYHEPAAVAHKARVAVDGAYETLAERLLCDGRFPALATHDERLVERAIAFAEANGIAPDRYEFQMLYGVRRDLQDDLRQRGFGVRIYVPYGREWYPYFMRRLAERPANVAFVLRSVLSEGRRPKA
jgi:proline dehydrogenase